jgi:hypothetical protein
VRVARNVITTPTPIAIKTGTAMPCAMNSPPSGSAM